jgi:hypothetical protein
MADQKVLKKRLKALMQQPSNQVCSDCPEKRPTWASLIVPPSDSPPGTEKIGSFCCLECSGSHRRLGVHISFVRSVNLDSCKTHNARRATIDFLYVCVFEWNFSCCQLSRSANLRKKEN